MRGDALLGIAAPRLCAAAPSLLGPDPQNVNDPEFSNAAFFAAWPSLLAF